MRFQFLTGAFKNRSARLSLWRAPAIYKRAVAALDKPGLGVFYWVLAWLSAMALQSVGLNLNATQGWVGQRMPAALVTEVKAARPPAVSSRPGQRAAPALPSGIVRRPAGADLAERPGTPGIRAKLQVRQAWRDEAKVYFRHGWDLAGEGILLALGVILIALVLRVMVPGQVAGNSMILLFVVISIITLIASKWCLVLGGMGTALPPDVVGRLVPLALAPILTAILMGSWPAIIMGFWVSFAVAIFAGYDFSIFSIGLAMGVVISLLARFVRTRARVLRIGLAAGGTGALLAVGFALIAHQSWASLVAQALACLAGGLLSALVVLMLLPLLEILFGVTTDISLLEFADMEHPLLKRLAIEAAGTYHHSLMVANLAQAAVAAIGGNSLRVAICSYFHDIGKLVKPEFFSENIPLGANPHDELLPSMSALVITAHVKEGVNLALQHKLPRPVVEAIQQHHGTALVSYFYHKAGVLRDQQADPQARGGGGTDVHEEDFRYDGPKPRSREVAVLSLADAIEAASRSLEKISSGHIENLVRDMIASKLKDGQLDECDLTLKEIGRLSRAFVFTLTNMLHGRIKYPSHEHSDQQPAEGRPA